MEKVLILLAGLPGTGKTFLGERLQERFGAFGKISLDTLKEAEFDRYGFANMQEKRMLEQRSWAQYYELMDKHMQAGRNILSDYPFSDKQKPCLTYLAAKYGYRVLTIRLIGDLDALYQRQRRRDLDHSRHLGHLVSVYSPGQRLADRSRADQLLSYEEFVKRCTTRGYDTFALGQLYELDVTDYAKVDYSGLMEGIKQWAAAASPL
ncbi:AAA family ATPase [Saccharibacillus endophyticus]|uniref:Kinase n=1 Tax=Saccharibacillus endophyticus TaxID=2060666 RepID=A0ABQ1ZSU4_9BACL|nr:AAA family ATPase [Saccharibacillus endophyticus]GGH75133.1 kinase [Saccharibacillus endophyticus]